MECKEFVHREILGGFVHNSDTHFRRFGQKIDFGHVFVQIWPHFVKFFTAVKPWESKAARFWKNLFTKLNFRLDKDCEIFHSCETAWPKGLRFLEIYVVQIATFLRER